MARPEFYRRNLPHYVPQGGTFFVTFRLAGSLPRAALERWVREDAELAAQADELPPEEAAALRRAADRQRFREAERLLDAAGSGPTWLADARVARLVADSLGWLSQTKAEVVTWCVMPNHVHALLTPRPAHDGAPASLSSVMNSLKGYTAHEANRLLGRKGAFWQHESYDHAVRSRHELSRITDYILANPVTAGLVAAREQWPWSGCANPLPAVANPLRTS